MVGKRKKYFLISIVAILIVSAILLAVFLIPKEITQDNYFNSLLNSNFTKQVQNTIITENDKVVYEKIETIIFDNEKVFHKIYEKKVSTSLTEEYDEITIEYYYSDNKMYYFEQDVWKSIDFDISNNLKSYDLKTEYFESFYYDKEIKNENKLTGIVKNQYVNDVFKSQTDFKNANIKMIVNKNFKIQTLNITAVTAQQRNVQITNTFTYNNENVNLPV